jgi:acyl-CoA thioester hydrolase
VTSPATYSLYFTADRADLDALGHVNNTVYLRWVQDVAAKHWETLAPADVFAAVAWVVLRHEIDYLEPAKAGDQLEARTWVGPVTGLRFERNTEIRRISDDRLLARARTLWCPIDKKSGKPLRNADELQAILTAVPPES